MTKKDLIIREAEEKDRSAIIDLIRSYERYDAKFARRYYEKYFTGDKMVHDDTVFVAELDNSRVIGVIGYCGDYLSTDDSYWLGWFVVAEECRGDHELAVGKELLYKVERELEGYEVPRLFVSVDGDNRRALSFYVKHGFRYEAVLRDYYDDGEDEIVLSKKLN